MLKRRLIPLLFIKNGMIVRSEMFSYHQNLGNVVNEAERYSDWDVDELVYVDITRDGGYDLRRDDHRIKSEKNIVDLLCQLSHVCFMPLTFGGGIRTLDDIAVRLNNGCDKITINTAAFENPEIISKAAVMFGKQCIVISIDYKIIAEHAIVHIRNGSHNTNVEVCEWVREVSGRGAGEIFLNSIERDGMATGYDLDTIQRVSELTSLPVIAAGGAGDEDDFLELAQNADISGIAAGNWFHFVEQSYPRAKKHLREAGINVR